MEVYQLIYQSQAMVPFETPELVALLQQARTDNQRLHITGLLLYTPDGRFLQVLEGSRDAVRTMYYRRIVSDPRHYNCVVISEGFSPARSFSDWRMGFRTAQPSDLRKLLGYVPPDSPALLVPRPHTRPELMELLHDFIAGCETEHSLEVPW